MLEPVSSVDDEHGDRASAAEELPVGTTVHRYVVIERVGMDASASIHAAYDPNLDRKVALKILRGSLDDRRSESLLTEAQALAKLTHPNVVRVHDVGTFEGRVFVAREFVEGRSFLRWLREAPRSRTDVRLALAHVARGLAAAHEAGFVHGGIRPRSVLVGDDGSVRVTDFGVGAGADETSPYVAPEQRSGAAPSPRADQFAFCLMALESLTGHPAIELAPDGVPHWPTIADVARKLPRRLLEVLEVGLAADPHGRHPSMLPIAARLEPGRRNERVFVAVGLCAAVLVGVFASATTRGTYCDDVSGRLDGVWDAGRRRAIERAFERTHAPFAGDAYEAVRTRLDAMADAWLETQTSACMAAEAGADELGLVARRMYCLERRLDELRAVSEVFEQADVDVVRRALEVVGAMTPVSTCDAFVQDVPAEGQREVVAHIEAGLAQVHALRSAGRASEAITLADRLVSQAAEVGYAPVEVHALTTRATIERPGPGDEDEERLHHAFSRALEIGDRARLADLAHAIGSHLTERRRFEEAAHWLDYADALLHGREISPHHFGFAGVTTLRGRIASLQARYDEAVEHFSNAVDQRIAAVGAEHEKVAIYRVNLAQALQDFGQYASADSEYRAALEVQRNTVGEHHPLVAQTHMGLAGLLSTMGRPEEALEHAQRAQSILVSIHGEEHVLVGDAHIYVAGALTLSGRETDALEQLERALAAYRAILGDRSVRAAIVYANIAAIRVVLEQPEVAVELYDQSLERMREKLGDDHPAIHQHRGNRIEALLGLRRLDEAEREATEVIEALARHLGAEHPSGSFAHEMLAEVHTVRGRHDAAVATLERALELRADRGELERASTQVLLARALQRAGRDASRALELESEARAVLEAGGPAGVEYLRSLDRSMTRIARAGSRSRTSTPPVTASR